MPFSSQQKTYIKGKKECVWCGWKQAYLDGVHLVDEIQRPAVNGVWMCKNCHAVFDQIMRPLLFKALVAYRQELEQLLPPSWKKCNKLNAPTAGDEYVGPVPKHELE